MKFSIVPLVLALSASVFAQDVVDGTTFVTVSDITSFRGDTTTASVFTQVVTSTVDATAVVPAVTTATSTTTDVVVVPTVLSTAFVTNIVSTTTTTDTAFDTASATVIVTSDATVIDDDHHIIENSAGKLAMPIMAVGAAAAAAIFAF